MLPESHADYHQLRMIVQEVVRRFGGERLLEARFPEIINGALDYVIDPVRTGRTTVSELDSIEKTFIGLKVEHFLRDELDVPQGVRDLRLAGMDVDIKNTVRSTWMIPPETFRGSEPCLLVMTATDAGHCSFGVMLARLEYLNAPNRDDKRSVSKPGKANIWWMLHKVSLPQSKFHGLNMGLFRNLREMKGGSARAASFFREHIGRVTHRSVIEALLHDQKDPMKRLRMNGGAGDLLSKEGLHILSGMYDQVELQSLGFEDVLRDEFVCIRR